MPYKYPWWGNASRGGMVGEVCLFGRFIRNVSGAVAIEYGLVLLLVAAAIIGGITAVGNSSILQLRGISEHLAG